MDTGKQCSLSVWTQADRSASTVRLKGTIKISSPIADRSASIVRLKEAVKVSFSHSRQSARRKKQYHPWQTDQPAL